MYERDGRDEAKPRKDERRRRAVCVVKRKGNKAAGFYVYGRASLIISWFLVWQKKNRCIKMSVWCFLFSFVWFYGVFVYVGQIADSDPETVVLWRFAVILENYLGILCLDHKPKRFFIGHLFARQKKVFRMPERYCT